MLLSDDKTFLFVEKCCINTNQTDLLRMIRNAINIKDKRYNGSPTAKERAEEHTEVYASVARGLAILLYRRTKEEYVIER